jgi:hypothetical protein
MFRYLGEECSSIWYPHMSRKLMKLIYMPLVYGQSQFSAITDIQQALEYALSRADANRVAAGL